jgi:hypothetical protein
MDVAVVPIIDGVGRAQEGVAENGEAVLEGTQDAEFRVRVVPDEVVVADVDGAFAKQEVDGASLARVLAIHEVQVGRWDVHSGWEGRDKFVEQRRGQCAECISAV